MGLYDKISAWWKQLSMHRRIAFAAGLMAYFCSYEYVHDFGVKRPLLAAAGVLVMIAAGGLRRTEGEGVELLPTVKREEPKDGHDRAAERERSWYRK